MFDFLRSEDSKLRRSAAQWLEMAQRIHDYRRDELPAGQGQGLLADAAAVKALVKQKAGAKDLKPAIAKLEGTMRACGGRVYPTGSMVENVEFFLVAAIVILGLRAYFVQPFKIPTNSMWPSYYGMTSEIFEQGEEPGMLRKAARLVGLGAVNYTLKAPADGEVLVPIFRNGSPAYTEKPGRSMFVFPTQMREYTVMVSGQPVKLTVPADWAQSEFGYDVVVEKKLFGGRPSGLYRAAQAANGTAALESSMMVVNSGGQRVEARVFWVPTGKQVKKGEDILSFDILTGDLLFVERVSYNFVEPKVGSGFVFKTDHINSVEMQDASGRQISQYYVKRLVGVPGDTLEIRPPVLYRNGQPIEGSVAFGKNARREDKYPGYTNAGGAQWSLGALEGASAAPGTDGSPKQGVLTVPENFYFALGDNSPRSKDSRYWGYVPEKDVVGRPLFIYYPLTTRWGPAK
ncbi:Signal peptidase I [Lacunisphaera limnophila]|uniref:Signal peptidase I n=1 Tax=Lacunisphaera limnophila TaxID=1838286 RepID=A0A1D8AY70_9BACT|nr:signal peptidase I [Lacunisphaera limnophila]AOS45839.1 Signal peptidase I [Lacunisphaera limnophila]